MGGAVAGRGDAVASPHILATQAGMEIFARGGNAVDAAIATNAVQGVVAPETCGIGGDLFALVATGDGGPPATLNASGPAGSGADAEALRRSGHTTMPRRHPAAVTVPGCVAGWRDLWERHGSVAWSELFAPAIRHADDGFPASAEFVRAVTVLEDTLRPQPAAEELYPDGAVPAVGDTVTRPALGATLRDLATDGPPAFYEGRPARAIVDALEGSITPADLAAFRPEWVDPIGLELWELEAWTVPPNSQGYLTPATLGIYDRIGAGLDPDDPRSIHLLVEAFRSVAWDAQDLVADPPAIDPASLLAEERLRDRAATIDPTKAVRRPPRSIHPGGTAYMCAVDRDGMAVSLIQSNYMGIGSAIGAGDAGFLLHNRGAGFDLRPGHPNELRPGRRPFHTLSPTLWTRDGEPAAVLGTRGGRHQPEILVQVALRLFGASEPVDRALAAPRWVTGDPGAEQSHLVVEAGMAPSSRDALADMGHRIEVAEASMSGWGPVSVITISESGLRIAGADPRVATAAAAVT
jgi:gamma-glutamyltranspeptidase/glutathione hydrolase